MDLTIAGQGTTPQGHISMHVLHDGHCGSPPHGQHLGCNEDLPLRVSIQPQCPPSEGLSEGKIPRPGERERC